MEIVLGEAAHLGEDVRALEIRTADSVEHQVHHRDSHHLARHVRAVDRSFEPVPVRDLLAGTLPVGLEVGYLLPDLLQGLAASFEPVLAVDRHFLRLLAVTGEHVVHYVDQEARGARGRVVDGIAKLRGHHFHHERPDLARGAELSVSGRTGRGG